jgi:protease-4
VTENHWNEPQGNSSKSDQDTQKQSLHAQGARGHDREGKLIEKLVMGLGAEQRRARRWGIFFKLLTFAYLTVLLVMLGSNTLFDSEPVMSGSHTALIDIKGTIADGEEAGADNIVGGLRRAFENKATRGIILRINSPGGSPVQAGYVFDEIRRLRALHPDIKVYSVIEDIGASGGYYIAAAADEIYADKASLVGSIGVTSSSFGFVGALKKLGVERRVLTAGEHKAFLDPFIPLKETEKEFWTGVLGTTHRQFIEQVKIGRGDRLKQDPKLFSGLIWSGEQALELGLIDGLGSPGYVAREVIGESRVVDFTEKPSVIERLTERLGIALAKTLVLEAGLKQPNLY